MIGDAIVIRTRLAAPRLPRHWLRRPRLEQLLAVAAEFPLTIVSASPGYGKSSALAAFATRGGWPTIWYSLHESSSDPLVFLLHLVHACRTLAPSIGVQSLALLEQSDSGALAQALQALINDLAVSLDDETLLILDDYQLIDDAAPVRDLLEQLIAFCPAQLHIVLATRHWPQISSLPTLRARGELYEVGEANLACTEDEIGELFASIYDYGLDASETQALHTQTGGWAIALQLVSQDLVGGQSTEISDALAASHTALFAYLAKDVLARQPQAIQDFLLRSSVLSTLDPTACDAVLGRTDSAIQLRMIAQRGLFLAAQDNGPYRYQPLFHAFLQHQGQASLPDWQPLHARAAIYYRVHGQSEQVVRHLLAAGDQVGAVRELEQAAQDWLDHGHAATLLHWLDQLPAPTLDRHPRLLIARGDAARLLAHFQEALRSYTDAEQQYAASGDPCGQAQALQGQATIFLDTVQPAHANELLRRAFKLLPPDQSDARAAVIRLIAENRLNSGRASQADRLYGVAERISGTNQPHKIDVRVLLRLGRLADVRARLEAELEDNDQNATHAQRPTAHRETHLLLALVNTFEGDVGAAQRNAQRGLDIAQRNGSTLAEAVAHIRLGHALQLGPRPDVVAANRHYLQAITLADTFAIPRTKAEAYLGLALLHGFNTDLVAAHAAAHAGLALAEPSGDTWMAALLWMAIALVGAAHSASETPAWVATALERAHSTEDTYIQTVVQLWTAIWHHRMGQVAAAAQHAVALLAQCDHYDYHELLIAPTLFGPRDRMMLVPILLAGRDDPTWSASAQTLLLKGFPAIAVDEATQSYHPGVGLRITSFERLRVWRGSDEIEPRAWQRKKAQLLLAMLLTNRHRWLFRDQICELIWPEASPSEAQTQFKVTLNALNAALEPTRPPRLPPFYVRRQGSAYRFCPPDGVWIDVEEFEARLIDARTYSADGNLGAARDELLAAVALYQNDYLSDYLYEDWAREERQRLALRYLEAATTLAELLLAQEQVAETIDLCEMVLARDSGWEAAYTLLMRAYARQRHRRLVMATYERCIRNLRATLDVAPLPQTTQLYTQLLHQIEQDDA